MDQLTTSQMFLLAILSMAALAVAVTAVPTTAMDPAMKEMMDAMNAAMEKYGLDMSDMDMGAMDMGAMDMGAMDMGAMDMGAMDMGAMDMGAMDGSALGQLPSPNMDGSVLGQLPSSDMDGSVFGPAPSSNMGAMDAPAPSAMDAPAPAAALLPSSNMDAPLLGELQGIKMNRNIPKEKFKHKERCNPKHLTKPSEYSANPCKLLTCDSDKDCFVDKMKGEHAVCCPKYIEVDCFAKPDMGQPCMNMSSHKEMRYFYNMDAGMCETLPFYGCAGNTNNFLDMETCQLACGSICKMPKPKKKKDRCKKKEMKESWYYCQKKAKCRRMKGGCKMAGNSFESRTQCAVNCDEKKPNKCFEDVHPGYCHHDKKMMWFYNYKTGMCQTFMHQGCGGNRNRFMTQVECESQCKNMMCQAPMEQGPCDESIMRWGHNKTSGHCDMFLWGGCDANSNNFESLQLCEINCLPASSANVDCEAKLDHGYCGDMNSTTRYFFDMQTGMCNTFPYYECGGNSNNFVSMETCQESCGNRCEEPLKEGPCDDYIVRYVYNMTSRRCEMFLWGGCESNGNNFVSMEDCENVCVPRSRCHEPMAKGHCKTKEAMWYYDISTGYCLDFTYHGCGGNDNRFMQWEDCYKHCGGICVEEVKPGPCNAEVDRWFYNQTSGMCEYFTWGGCEPNGNNFKSWYDCTSNCPEVGELQDDYYDSTTISVLFDDTTLGGGDNNEQRPANALGVMVMASLASYLLPFLAVFLFLKF